MEEGSAVVGPDVGVSLGSEEGATVGKRLVPKFGIVDGIALGIKDGPADGI